MATIHNMVRSERFELPTLWFEARCSIQLSYERTIKNTPPSKKEGQRAQAEALNGVSEGVRTLGLQGHNLAL